MVPGSHALSAMTDALVARGVSVRFARTEALRDVTVEFSPGVTGLLGHNGAGKSTLMGVLTGLLRPSEGEVRFGGLPAAAGQPGNSALRASLGLLPQKFGYFGSFRVREFVEYAAWLHAVDPRSVPAAVDRALETVGMVDRQEAKMKSLSGGMAQRVGIACATVHEPRVLVLDEPTNGLDIEQRDIFRGILRDLQQRHPQQVTILSSHLAEDIAAVCERVVVLQQGRLVADAPTREMVGVGPDADVTGVALEQAYLRVLGARP